MKTCYLPLLLAFNFHFSYRSTNTSFKVVSQLDSVKHRLEIEKMATDKYLHTHKKNLIVFVKRLGKRDLVRVTNNKWPNEIEYTLNILTNPSGKIIYIAQIPFSESGDWDIIYKHYFDEQGKTFAFSKQASTFNDNVKGGVVREILLRYYDEGFKNIKEINRLTDKDNHLIKEDKANYDFPEYKYSVYKNVKECLNAYHINL